MHSLRKDLPSNPGRPLRNILHHYRGYKAEEWAAWITMYSLPLLKGRLPSEYYNGWSLFVRAVRLCQKKVISVHDLNNINELLLKFYTHYEKKYYKNSIERISAMKICVHYMLHISSSIQNNGPCWATWQFPIERVSDEYKEKFLGPTKHLVLSNAELKKIKEHYVTNYNIKANQLQVK
ncbi:3699_t:CDS:2 [Gigaspora rosea]|nr:3699_t:CDS:2 [Gigaspora rosea]